MKTSVTKDFHDGQREFLDRIDNIQTQQVVHGLRHLPVYFVSTSSI